MDCAAAPVTKRTPLRLSGLRTTALKEVVADLALGNRMLKRA